MNKTILALSLCTLSAVAGGQYKTHDGFMFRYTLGFGGLSNTLSDGIKSLDMGGSGLSGSMTFGGSLNSNLTLGLEMNACQAQDPELSANGQSITAGGTKLTNFNIGPALSYYFPSNLYAGAGLGIGQFQSSNSTAQTVGTSDLGYGITLNVGKEWWASANWGLGLNANLQYLSASDSKTCSSCKISGASYGLAFSATFN